MVGGAEGLTHPASFRAAPRPNFDRRRRVIYHASIAVHASCAKYVYVYGVFYAMPCRESNTTKGLENLMNGEHFKYTA